MKNKQILLAVFCACVLLACAASCIFVNTEIAKRKAAASEMDSLIQTNRPDIFTNTAALEDFDTYLNREADYESDDALYMITSPQGIVLRSYSQYWDEANLQRLYEELMRNKHGEEMDYLKSVTVYAKESEHALASHIGGMGEAQLVPRFPALQGFSLTLERYTGVISLYGGDTIHTVEGMAKSLSHEYGHHYVSYHMFDDASLADTGSGVENYIRLRGLPKDRTLNRKDNPEKYQDMHYWFVGEIAAEDYVLLMGSPTTRQVVDYYDVMDRLYGAQEPEIPVMSGAINLYPQENLMIPLSLDVPGLRDYFYSFIDDAPASAAAEAVQCNLQIEKDSVGYNLAAGYKTFVHYKIRWDKPFAQEDAVYTLLCYDPENYGVIPIKTVRGGEEALAYTGTVTADYGDRIEYLSDSLDSGTKTFLVSMVLSDGTVALSQPIAYTFD